jgi:hypothetical protein
MVPQKLLQPVTQGSAGLVSLASYCNCYDLRPPYICPSPPLISPFFSTNEHLLLFIPLSVKCLVSSFGIIPSAPSPCGNRDMVPLQLLLCNRTLRHSQQTEDYSKTPCLFFTAFTVRKLCCCKYLPRESQLYQGAELGSWMGIQTTASVSDSKISPFWPSGAILTRLIANRSLRRRSHCEWR